MITKSFSAVAASLALTMVLFSGSSAFAQQNKQKIVEDHTVRARDGWPIHLTYYKQKGESNSPVVVLLHGKGSDSLIWKNGFADKLWDEGYAVVAVDLRKHGESKGTATAGNSRDATDLRPNDYGAMVAGDMEAVKGFLFDEHMKRNLNMRKTAIIGIEMSSVIALNYAAADWAKPPYDDAPTLSQRTPRGQDIRAVVLISPESSLPRLSAGRAVNMLKNIPFAVLICVGEKDRADRGTADKLYQQFKMPQNEDWIYYRSYDYSLRGADLLAKVPISKGHILAFLDKHLKELNDPWQDRRSRLRRDDE